MFKKLLLLFMFLFFVSSVFAVDLVVNTYFSDGQDYYVVNENVSVDSVEVFDGSFHVNGVYFCDSSFRSYFDSSNICPYAGGGGSDSDVSREELVSDVEAWDFIVGDGICQYSLGESGVVSPGDCAPRIVDYALCLVKRGYCFDDGMWKRTVLVFFLVIVMIFACYKFFPDKFTFLRRKRFRRIIR